MRKARGIQRRLVAYSLGLALIVALSFVWLSQRSMRASLAERQEEYHTSVFRISNEYLNDYLYALDGKLASLAKLPPIADRLDEPVVRGDFRFIARRLESMAATLAKRFWPQDKVEELLLLGKAGGGYSFGLNSGSHYLGDDFDFEAFLAGHPSIAALGPGKTALLYNPDRGGIKLTDAMADRLIFAKRLARADGSSGGLAVAILSPAFLPALFTGLADDSAIRVDDASGHLIWANRGEARASGETRPSFVRSSFLFEPTPLRLGVGTDLEAIYPALGRLDPVIAIAALACLALVALVAPLAARSAIRPLDELASRLAEFSETPRAEIESAKTLAVPGTSILTRLFAYFGLTAVLPVMLFIALTAWRSYSTIDGAVARYVTATIRQAETYIDYNFEVYAELTSQFIYSDEFQAEWPIGLEAPLPEPGRAFVEGYFSRLSRSKGEFFAINLYSKEGRPVYVGLDTEGSNLREALGDRVARLDESIGQLILIGAVKNQYEKSLLVFGRKVRGLRYFPRPDLGYALFFVEPYQLNQVYGVLGTSLSKYLFVVDGERNVLAGYGGLSELGGGSGGGRDGKLRIDSGSASWDYQMVGRIPSSEIRLMLLPVILTGVYIIVVHMAIILLLAGLFASTVMRPVRRLLATMRSADGDHPPPEGLVAWFTGRSELAEIATRFNDLVLDNYRGRLRANELAVLEREAQLNALQQQINPHFMYNTLEAIKWMAYRRGETEISDMASAMGKFLRGNMALGEHFVSLAEEIEHLKSYLHIQQIRYEGRFDVAWDLELGLEEAVVPRLILQPIVENAIDHGFDEIRYKGRILIRGRRAPGAIALEIVDNGRGMGAEELLRVRSGIEGGRPKASESIGLANVGARLRLTLGRGATLGIESSEGGGTTVSMLLPQLP